MSEQREFEFKAEVQRVLSLVIHSLYTNPEVFLRELISNASDALDKARFLQLTESDAVTPAEGEPRITITLDREKRTLVIEDNGIGLTREEAIENLGTIARSGTAEFLDRFAEVAKAGDKEQALELVGQFGVGFYSVFMVASRVDVDSLAARKGSEPILWRSTGEGSFTVLPGTRTTPGTSVTLHLKEDATEFAEDWRVRAVIEKYSNFVMFPILVNGEVANQSSALWRLPRTKVTEEQHAEFFKLISGGVAGEKPLHVVHYAVDAPVQFHALLYVPEKAAHDMVLMQRERPGLRLYARRVLIMESCGALLPPYLRFVRGVVDSEDLQLNVSRETLQENRTVRQIEQQLTRQVLKALEALADEDPEKYAVFWRRFGMVFKEGVSVDFKNRDQLARLCRFQSLNTPDDGLVSFAEYAAKSPEGQKEIFYLTGTDRQQTAKSPLLEAFRARGIDVLLLTDPVDEWVVNALAEVDGRKLVSVAHGEVNLDAIAAPNEPPAAETPVDDEVVQAAVKAIERVLGERVEAVRASRRLTDSASCLVAREGDPGANLERLMRLLDDGAVMARKRILEVNPGHPVIQNLGRLARRDPESTRIQPYAELLYDQALLAEGVVEDPAALVRRIQDLLVESSAHLCEE